MQKSISLRFTQGSSDKAYNLDLSPDGDLWVVNFSYGKYGGTLKAGTKTPKPVTLETAQAIYDDLLEKKTSKGYSSEGDGVAFAGTKNAGRVTGYLPQLLNPMDEQDILAMIAREPGLWTAEEKHDGERRGLKVMDGVVVSANRKGLEIPTQALREEAVRKLVSAGLNNFELDCEDMGDHVVIFDLLCHDQVDLRGLPFSRRMTLRDGLAQVFTQAGVDDIFRITHSETGLTHERAADLIRKHRGLNSEGLVFKREDAPYTVGKPGSGGTQLKLKFTNDATVRVMSHTQGKRSVGMEVLGEAGWEDVGNVTIPANHDIPEVGALVDIKYLYAYPKGALFQPVYKGIRTDLEEADCCISKLVYKRGTAA